MERAVLKEKVVPAFVFFALWLDGWFYPLLLLPVIYVLVVEKRDLGWLGFRKQRLLASTILGLLVSSVVIAVYYPTFLYYVPPTKARPPSLHDVFTDVVWYPLYEEIAYRAFFLAHIAGLRGSERSRRNALANLAQSLLFVAIHWHHVISGTPLVLLSVFLLALLNGFVFLKTRNLLGCLLSHSAVNGFALAIRYAP